MYKPDVTQLLAELTGGWRPGSGTTAGSLIEARAALAATLRAGISPTEVNPAWRDAGITPAPAASAEIAEISRAVEAAIQAQPFPVAAYVRSPLSGSVNNPAGVPAWARGMKIQRTLGPFLDAQGISHSVVIIQLTLAVQFAFGDAANVFAVFPERFTILPHPATE